MQLIFFCFQSRLCYLLIPIWQYLDIIKIINNTNSFCFLLLAKLFQPKVPYQRIPQQLLFRWLVSEMPFRASRRGGHDRWRHWSHPEWVPRHQVYISSHSWQLLLKKYCRKSALTACSPRFSPSGTWASTTTSMGSGPVLLPSGCSSPMPRALATSSRSLQSIILTQRG